MGYLSHRVDRSEIKPGDHIYTWRTAYTYSHHGIYVGGDIVIHFTADENANSDDKLSLLSSVSSSYPTLSTSCLSPHISGDSISVSNENITPSCLCPLSCGFRVPRSGVVLSCLNCFIGTGSVYLFQYGVNPFVSLSKIRGGTCTIAKSDPPEEVIEKATYLLQTGFGSYDVFENNCEVFALYCKTGFLIRGNGRFSSSGQVNFMASTTANLIVTSVLKKFVCGPVVSLAIAAGNHYHDRYKSDIGVRGDVVKVKVDEVSLFLSS